MENSVNLEFYKNPRSKESILLWFPLHFTSNSVEGCVTDLEF